MSEDIPNVEYEATRKFDDARKELYYPHVNGEFWDIEDRDEARKRMVDVLRADAKKASVEVGAMTPNNPDRRNRLGEMNRLNKMANILAGESNGEDATDDLVDYFSKMGIREGESAHRDYTENRSHLIEMDKGRSFITRANPLHRPSQNIREQISNSHDLSEQINHRINKIIILAEEFANKAASSELEKLKAPYEV